jgi:hypothetical protein
MDTLRTFLLRTTQVCSIGLSLSLSNSLSVCLSLCLSLSVSLSRSVGITHLHWFEENEFIANVAAEDGNPDSSPLIEIFSLSSNCHPAGLMQELVECYMYDESPLKELGWASTHSYMTNYIKEW